MIQRITKTESDHLCAATLIETDRCYFEMAAEVHQLSCGSLAWMSGLTNLAASCVVQRVEFDKCQTTPESWLSEVENEVAQRKVGLVRIYVEECPMHLQQLLVARGYQRRTEFGFLGPQGWQKIPGNVEMHEVVSAADWNAKLQLHAEAMYGPDGYTNQADLWVEMERRKCDTGQLRCFLIRRDGVVSGAVGAILHAGLLRLKNIVVSPRCRRTGLGVATVQMLRRMADQDHGCRLGVFGVEGGIGARLYRQSGLREVTRQFEWSRLID